MRRNERVDGEEDKPKGMHGFEDDRFMQVYIPPNFKARITTFIILLWLFAAATGVAFTIGPLLLGRWILQPLTSDGKPPNDLFAVTVGFHVAGLVIYAIAYCYRAIVWAREHITTHRAQLYPIAKYLLGLLYLGAACCMLVVVSSLLLELYIHVPLQELLISEMEPEELPEISRSPIGTFHRSTIEALKKHESNGPHKLVSSANHLPPTILDGRAVIAQGAAATSTCQSRHITRSPSNQSHCSTGLSPSRCRLSYQSSADTGDDIGKCGCVGAVGTRQDGDLHA